jgi:Protein-L-isoaspartate(D-aspartate) O-methyltransferase (PCMT)
MPLTALRSYLRRRRRSGPRSTYAYLGDGLGLTTLQNGLLLLVDTRDVQAAPHLIARGSWESNVEFALAQLLRPGQRIVEVGANLGYYTVMMASAVGPSGHILSVEANARHAELVRRPVYINGFSAWTEASSLPAVRVRTGDSAPIAAGILTRRA